MHLRFPGADRGVLDRFAAGLRRLIDSLDELDADLIASDAEPSVEVMVLVDAPQENLSVGCQTAQRIITALVHQARPPCRDRKSVV
jgi:hypothetical protein